MRKGKISLKQLKKDLKKLTSGKINRRSQFGEGCDGLDGMYTREGDSWGHPMSCYDYHSTYGVYPKSEKPVSARPISARPISARPISARPPVQNSNAGCDVLFNDEQLTEIIEKSSCNKGKFLLRYHPDKIKNCSDDNLKHNNFINLTNKWNQVCGNTI